MEKLYSCEQVAQRYGVRVSTVWAWIREKKLSAVKIGKMYRINECEIAKFENNNGKQKRKEVKKGRNNGGNLDMCKLKSAIILKDMVFIPDYDSHDKMLTELRIKDTRENAERLFVRAELSPQKNDLDSVFTDVDSWAFNVDQDVVPEWYVREVDEQRMRESVKEWAKKHIFVGVDGLNISSGEGYYIKDCTEVIISGSATIERISGPATVKNICDSATVKDIDGFATVNYICGVATVEKISDSATVTCQHKIDCVIKDQAVLICRKEHKIYLSETVRVI